MPNFMNTQPYYDNAQHEIDADYVQVLFQPSRAVQARELTTLQSLIQNQLSSVGDFLFADGSVVQGGQITFDNSVTAIQLQANDSVSLSDFQGKLLINPSGPVTVQAIVIAVDSTVASNTCLGALVVKYLSADTFGDGDQIQIATGDQEQATLLLSNSTYQGSIASINEGVLYADGYLVQIDTQTIVLDSTTATPSVRIGLQINAGIVNSTTDSSLLDPAQGSSNYQAPGADRYQYQLVLSSRLLSSTDDSMFFELMRIVNGVIVSTSDYAVLGNIDAELAQRTYDSQGNFTVTPFIATAMDDPANTAGFIMQVGPGKGYVRGYEFQTISPVKMSVAKAQTTNTNNNYVMTTDFGNFFTVTNLYTGNSTGFNTANFGSLDIHIVPSANINTSNSIAYSNTKIGTCKVRDFEWDGTNEWNAYTLDIALKPMVVNAANVSANTSMVYLPATFTGSANAIQNVPFTVLAGNSSGDSRVIVSYNATNKIGYLNLPTTQLLDTSSQISLGFATKDINSLVATPANTSGGNSFFTQNSTSGLYACMDIATNGGKDPYGNTILFETNINTLAYTLPQSFIAQNTFSNVTFYNRKTLTNVAFTAGNTTIGTGSGLDPNEVYTFGYTGAFLPDLLASENFIVMVRNAQTSGFANGSLITWKEITGNGVYQTDSTHVTLATNTVGNFLADILLTVQDQNASVNFRRTKTLTGNTSNTVLLSTDSYLNGVAVIGTANANSQFIDTANGYVWFLANGAMFSQIPGNQIGLGLPDIVQIIKIYDSGNPSFMPNTQNAIDITSNYLFTSGQKDNYYDHGQLILQPGANPPQGQTVVMMQYYAHDATTGFFSADSYTASNYANNQIPVYVSAAYGAIPLRDVIDFRPTRTIGTTANIQTFTINGLRLPEPDSSMTLTYSFYLPRQDSLVLTSQRQFQIVTGLPSLTPQTPASPPGVMPLYTYSVEAYTYSSSNVQLSYIENKRYTMRDIGALDNRIQQLEYYESLSQLDTGALNTTVLYQNGTTAKEQYGILTDAFTDFSVADASNPDLFCYIANNELMPYQQTKPIEFMFTGATGPYGVNDRTYSVSYTETPAIVQNTASDYTQVQPFAFGQFNGDVALRPQTDIWYSGSLIPQIIGPVASPPAPTPPAKVPSTITLPNGVGNKANLSPPVITTLPKPTSAPHASTPILAAVTPKSYCIDDTDDYFYTHSVSSYIYGVADQAALCLQIATDYTGYGVYQALDGAWVLGEQTAAPTTTIRAANTAVKITPIL